MVMAFAALLVCGGARAQFADVQVPAHVYIAVPFTIEVTLDCPPPGEAPPPQRCDGGTLAYFGASDHTAVTPRDALVLFPTATTLSGRFIFHRPGPQFIELLTEDGDFLGAATFLVEPPSGPMPRR